MFKGLWLGAFFFWVGASSFASQVSSYCVSLGQQFAPYKRPAVSRDPRKSESLEPLSKDLAEFVSELPPYLERLARAAIKDHQKVDTNSDPLKIAQKSVENLKKAEQDLAFYANHGVAHVMDVVRVLPKIIDTLLGKLLGPRSQERKAFMKELGQMLALQHDREMYHQDPAARKEHPVRAAQLVQGKDFDPILEPLQSSLVYKRLLNLGVENPEKVMRELIALSVAHSKSAVPVELLNDLPKLVEYLRKIKGFESDSFEFLLDTRFSDLQRDVVDTLRALRIADSFRMRGERFSSSHGNQIYAVNDGGKGLSIFELNGPNGERAYVKLDKPIAYAEASLKNLYFDKSGNLHFHFPNLPKDASPAEMQKAIDAFTMVVDDVAKDSIGSLVGAGGSGPHNGIKIVIHGPKGSDANFLEPLKQKIGQTLPPGYGKVETVGDAEPFPPKTQSMAGAVKRIEDNRVKLSAPCTGDCLGEIQSAYTKLNAGAPSGPEFEAFSKAVRILHVKKGEILIHAGAPPGLVYLTSKAGGDLSIAPEGHESFASAPSVFLGGTALVANQPRNAQVQATRDTYVFIVPSDLYRTYFSKNIIGPENIPERFGRSPTP